MLSVALIAVALGVVTPTREQLNKACYSPSGPTKECTLMLAQAIVGNAKKCYDMHKEREAYTGCTSSFCFSECGEAEGCAELCDEKAEQAYAVFSKTPYEAPARSDDVDMFLQLDANTLVKEVRSAEHAVKNMLRGPKAGAVAAKVNHHKCRVLCQRFMFKTLGDAFKSIDHP